MKSPRVFFLVSLLILLCSLSFRAQQSPPPQPSAADDFYIYLDGIGSQYPNRNDAPPGQYPWYYVTTPAHADPPYQMSDGGRLVYSPKPYFTFGVDWFVYKHCADWQQTNCGGSGTIHILVIRPQDNTQGLGRTCKEQQKNQPPPLPAGVGKPVNVTNGNMWLEQMDYSHPGLGENLQIDRFYNSQLQSSGLFGFGWTTKYDERLTLYSDTNVVRLDLPDAQGVFFARAGGTGPFTAISKGYEAQIVKNTDNTYTLTMRDGSSRHFSSAGILLWQRDRNGNQTTLNYDINGRLTSVVAPGNRTLTLVPNSNGTVSQISDGLGVVADYEYFPGTTLLKTVTYSDGSKYKFEYDHTVVSGKIFLKTVKDALDNVVETHVYDNQGRATTSEIHGGAEKYTINYTHQTLTTVTDVLGRVTKYNFTTRQGRSYVSSVEGLCGCGGSGAETTTYTFFDGIERVFKSTNALGQDTFYEYDLTGNLKKIIDVYGNQEFTYNTSGDVLTHKDRMGGVWTYTYDAVGNLLTLTDPLNKVTTLEYPTTNNKGLPDSIKDARNNVTKVKWFASGLLDEIEDPYTKKTKFTYDARGRTKTVTNALNHVTTYNYFDDTNRKVEMVYPNADKITYKYDIRRLLESVTDERGKITGYEFDPQYRLKKITDPLGHFKEFGYDDMSNMTSYKDALGNITNYVYDDFNRLKEITHPAAIAGGTQLVEKFEYDKLGRRTKYTDTANRDTLYGYNDATRTNTVANAEGEITTVKYNQRFQTTEVKDAINQTYTFNYDPLGRLLSQTRAGGTMSFEYDNVGNRKKRTDYMGRVTNYVYDNLNRLTKIEYEPGMGNAVDKPQSTYGYDEISQLTSAVNDAGTVSFNYDNRGRVINTTDVFGKVIAYEYERTPTVNQGRLKLDGANYAFYNYDDAGRLANIVNASNSTTTTFGYDNEDKVTSRVFPNGVTTTYEYYNNDLLKRLKDATTSATLFDRQYTYNSANQIGTITDLTNTRTFSYDNLDRLTGVSVGSPIESYSFDDVGNRTASHLSTTYGYQSGQFNRLSSTATATYGFDENGNTRTKSEGSNLWSYNWDYENRMVEASTRKQKVRYKYDALGRRVQRFRPGWEENTKYTHDGLDVLVDNDNGTLTKYLNGPGIDNKLRVQTGSSISYFLADHLGSTNGLTDATGNLTSFASYDSFGNATGNLASRYQFTGREQDAFSGLQFSRARFYDAKLGRFLSEDPIGFRGGDVNLYGYVWNSPLAFTDPMGLDGGWGNNFADWLDDNIERARRFYQGPVSQWGRNGTVNTVADLSFACADMFRVGNGIGYAMYAPDENGWGRAAFIAQDVVRGAGLFSTMAGPFAGRFGGKPAVTPPDPPTRPFNPFKGKTPAEIDEMFRNKGFSSSGPDPQNGYGGYVNPRSGRSYHIDPKEYGKYREPNHVDVNRPRGYKGSLKKKKFEY